jgi:cellulase/cellobiase CelA1
MWVSAWTGRHRLVVAIVTGVVVLAVVGALVVRGAARHTAPRAGPPAHQPSASPSPVPSQSSGPRAVKAGYSVRGRWDGGFNAEIVVTNLGSQPLEGWTVRLEMPDGVRMTGAWSAEATQVAAVVTLRSQPWNTYVAPGGTVHMGFQASGGAADPSSCTVNGAPC